MAADITKSQLEKLGRRLRKGTASPDDLRLLAGYRRSFLAPYREVIRRIGLVTPLVPSGRPAKSTASIVAKLQRQTITLPQMQDIAGCRLVTENVVEQDLLVERLSAEFPGAEIVDRRRKPSAGYRAVHLVVESGAASVEIQVRTRLQDLWAQCSEQLAFSIDRAIKYGGGPQELASLLCELSDLISLEEFVTQKLDELRSRYRLERYEDQDSHRAVFAARLDKIETEARQRGQQVRELLGSLIAVARHMRRAGRT